MKIYEKRELVQFLPYDFMIQAGAGYFPPFFLFLPIRGILVITTNIFLGPVLAQGHKAGAKYDCKIDWLWVRSALEQMKHLFWCRGKARRRVPPFNTQCLQNLAESGERSALTLGSLCLPCCVRDAA